jgi:hypothetical protein
MFARCEHEKNISQKQRKEKRLIYSPDLNFKMYRRKVKGSILGSSKTGSIAYIEPEATLRYSRELNNLEYEEREEITRILGATIVKAKVKSEKEKTE